MSQFCTTRQLWHKPSQLGLKINERLQSQKKIVMNKSDRFKIPFQFNLEITDKHEEVTLLDHEQFAQVHECLKLLEFNQLIFIK